jgi:uncharacterized repeat protein (TIGR01451 family)
VDPNPDNNEITVTSGVTTQSDLRIAKSDDPDPVIAGESLTYVLTVTNDGPSNASGVQVVDTLPSYADYVSYSVEPAGPTCSEMGGIVTCDMGTMGAGEQCNTNYPSEYVITIETLVDPKTPCSAGQCPGSPAGPLVNEATVTVDNCEPDPDPSNNTVTEETEVLAGADVLIAASCSAFAMDTASAGVHDMYASTISSDSSVSLYLSFRIWIESSILMIRLMTQAKNR